MVKTKAAFKALREECGLSQQDVADEAEVTLSSVKKWENPRYDSNQPPGDVWLWLLEMRDELEEEARASCAKLLSMHRGDGAPFVTYYRTQEQLDAAQLPCGLDRPVGYVNATTRRAVQLLREAHVDVDVLYPEQREFVYAESLG